MPELPEVETVAQGLRTFLSGCTFTGVNVHWVRSIIPAAPQSFTHQLVGRRVTDVSRRGKWIVVTLDNGQALLIHLRMTGRLLVGPDAVLGPGECREDTHIRVSFSLDEGRTLQFCDQRKFGRLWLVDDTAEALSALGPEPLDPCFTAERLRQMLSSRRGRIKPLLLNQRFLAGLGNIYADEVLWRARIHPAHRAHTLTPDEVEGLFHAIRTVLTAAIASGGTTLADAAYQRLDGSSGAFADQLAVYGKEGEPCIHCSTPIQRLRLNQRSAHFCPRCQQPPSEPSTQAS